MRRRLAWTWLGRAAYGPVWELQEERRRRILAGDEDAECLLFVEHEPVITLGRSADEANVLLSAANRARRGIPVVRTNRGGDVTVHGPGQLVIYPVVRLRHGVVAHLEACAGAIVDELACVGVVGAQWRRSPAGVWVGDAKIAACGVHVTRGVAIHGFALNVTHATLAMTRWVVPCGLRDARVTSIESEAARAPALVDLARALAVRIGRVWERTPSERSR